MYLGICSFLCFGPCESMQITFLTFVGRWRLAYFTCLREIKYTSIVIDDYTWVCFVIKWVAVLEDIVEYKRLRRLVNIMTFIKEIFSAYSSMKAMTLFKLILFCTAFWLVTFCVAKLFQLLPFHTHAKIYKYTSIFPMRKNI